jgi:cytochrome c oxidase subunit 4
MDTAVDTPAGSGGHAAAGSGEHAHAEHGDAYYWKIAAALAGITGLEVLLSYQAKTFGKAFLPILLFLMVVKFVTVVSEFMHLRLDNKVFKYLFYSGLILAVLVYLAALLTFRFFAS